MPEPSAQPVRTFARAGASEIEEPNTLEAFRLALRLGATGLQADVWATADGLAVLDSDGVIGPRFRRRRIAELSSDEIAGRRLSFGAIGAELGTGFDVLVNLRDPAALDSVIESSGDVGLLGRLTVMSTDLAVLGALRDRDIGVATLHSARMENLPRGLEHHAAQLRSAGVEALSLPFDEWTAGHVALFHRFTRSTFARGACHERQMVEVLGMGVDALVSPYVDRMVDATRAG